MIDVNKCLNAVFYPDKVSCNTNKATQSKTKKVNQFNAGVLSQSASSNHALLITKSARVIKKTCPLSQPISIQ